MGYRFNPTNHSFTCEPKCVNRKPGCHDHCEKYQTERAAYDDKKKLVDERRHIDDYTIDTIRKNIDKRAKNQKNRCGRKQYRR